MSQQELLDQRSMGYAEGQRDSQQRIAALEAQLAERTQEVEHWVTRYKELEAWRVSTAQLLAKSEAQLAEVTRLLEEIQALPRYMEHEVAQRPSTTEYVNCEQLDDILERRGSLPPPTPEKSEVR